MLCAKSLQSCPILCDPMGGPGSSVHGILQARILEWLPFPSPGDLPDPGIKPMFLTSPALAGRFFNTSTTWEAQWYHIWYYIWYHLDVVPVYSKLIKKPLNLFMFQSAQKVEFIFSFQVRHDLPN